MDKKINRLSARMRWNAGKPFWITPCNMRKEAGILIDPNKCGFSDFDALVHAFIWYNCDNERGRYPHYYTAD